MNFHGESHLLSGFHFARGPPHFLYHWPKGPEETLAGHGAHSQGCGAGLTRQESGECWWPEAPHSEQVLLGWVSDPAGRAAGCPALGPTVPASVAEAGRRTRMLLQPLLPEPLHCPSERVCSGPGQAHSHAFGPQRTGQHHLLECSGLDAAEQSELQVLS